MAVPPSPKFQAYEAIEPSGSDDPDPSTLTASGASPLDGLAVSDAVRWKSPRAKTSVPAAMLPSVKGLTRFVALEAKATKRPSALIVGSLVKEVACAESVPAALVVIMSVVPGPRS